MSPKQILFLIFNCRPNYSLLVLVVFFFMALNIDSIVSPNKEIKRTPEKILLNGEDTMTVEQQSEEV